MEKYLSLYNHLSFNFEHNHDPVTSLTHFIDKFYQIIEKEKLLTIFMKIHLDYNL